MRTTIEKSSFKKKCNLSFKRLYSEANKKAQLSIAGVPGEKPSVTSDKLPDSPSKFPCIHL